MIIYYSIYFLSILQKLYQESLLDSIKWIALICDLLNGIIYESGNLALTNARVNGILAFVLSEVLYIILIVIIVAILIRSIPLDDCFQKIGSTIIVIFSIIGLNVYLIVDNYHLIEQIRQDQYLITLNDTDEREDIFGRINIVQPALLLLAILLFKVIPTVCKQVMTWYGGNDSKTEKDDELKLLTKSFWIGAFNVLTLTTEFDAWFTLIQAYNDCSSQVYIVWGLWICIVVIYSVFLVLIFIFTLHYKEDYQTEPAGYKIILLKLIICIWIVLFFSLYLLGDNRQPLDCYNTLTLGFNGKIRSILKLFFLSFALVSFVCIGVIFLYNILVKVQLIKSTSKVV